MSALVYRYRFTFPDGTERLFALELDRATLALRAPTPRDLPAWTRLGHYQCANCPLNETAHPRCPVAVNMQDVVLAFGQRLSFEVIQVEVEAHGRTYRKRAPLQESLSSLIGVVMVTSGCPVLDRMRPMVATHLPFMSTEESTYRTVSMYLLAQHFIAREGGHPDWELEGLVAFLEEARVANAGFCGRLQSLGITDASLNALYRLNALGEMTSITILEDELARWRRVFRAHWLAPPHPR